MLHILGFISNFLSSTANLYAFSYLSPWEAKGKSFWGFRSFLTYWQLIQLLSKPYFITKVNSIQPLFTLAHPCVFISSPFIDMSFYCKTLLRYVFFLQNKGLSWDNYILIERRKTLNSSILVIHADLRDRVNSDSAIWRDMQRHPHSHVASLVSTWITMTTGVDL